MDWDIAGGGERGRHVSGVVQNDDAGVVEGGRGGAASVRLVG